MEVNKILKYAGGSLLAIFMLLVYVIIQSFTSMFASSQMSDEIPKQFFQTEEGIKVYNEIYYPVIKEYQNKYSIEIPLSFLAVPNWSANIKETKDIVKHEAEQAIDKQDQSDDPVQNHIPEVSKKPSNTQQETQPQLPAKPAEKSFLFSAGFTYDSAYTACNQYGKSLISQNIINGYTCTPIKVDDEYTGYHISFP